MIKIGDIIPDMELDAFDNGEIKKIKLTDYKGKWVVLILYPADFTFVCPTELEEIAENYNDFKKLNAEVLSVSTDTAYVHKGWHDVSPAIKKIRYPMLADPAGQLCKALGTYIEDEGISLRATFIFNPEGILKTMEMHDNSIGRNTKEILRKLRASKYVNDHQGEVCPASWDIGEDTIKPSIELVGNI